jgi:hypothetical protein
MAELERPADELRALGRLAFAELADAIGGNGALHGAIAGRVFGHAGPGARPAQAGHDAIAAGAYAAVGGAHHLALLNRPAVYERLRGRLST